MPCLHYPSASIGLVRHPEGGILRRFAVLVSWADAGIGSWGDIMFKFNFGFTRDGANRQRAQTEEARQAFTHFQIPLHMSAHDPEAIQRALEEIDRAIDERLATCPDNPIAREMAESIKKKSRQQFLDHIAKANRHGVAE